MRFLTYVVSLFLIYKASFYLVLGQSVNEIISDCTKLYNYLYKDFKKYGNSCCNKNGVECDNEGYITKYINSKENYEFPDIIDFPYFSRIESLEISNVNLKEIPDSILKLSTLKYLQFFQNNMEVIPPTIQNLSELEHLKIEDNDITVLPDELFNLINLKSISFGANKIEEIPSAIQNLSKLEYINLNANYIEKLPSEIFNLANLKEFYIKDNVNLKTKLINFDNSIIEYCGFDSDSILCYESGTCKSIVFDDNVEYVDEAETEFKRCTKEDIEEVLNNKKSNSLLIVIIICVIVDLIGFIITFIIVKKKRSKKRHVDPNSSFNDVFRNKREIRYKYDTCIKTSIGIAFITFITVALTLFIKVLIQN